MAGLEEEKLEKILNTLKETEDYWNETITNMAKKLSCSSKDVVALQSDVSSQRQQINEQIKARSYDLYKMMPKIKSARKQRFEYYAGALSPYATNSSERTKLIEWDLATLDHKKDILDVHIEFLRESMKVMDNIGFAIKNKISLYQLTDME